MWYVWLVVVVVVFVCVFSMCVCLFSKVCLCGVEVQRVREIEGRGREEGRKGGTGSIGGAQRVLAGC